MYCLEDINENMTVVKEARSGCCVFQTFGDFGIIRKIIFFSLPLVNFTAVNVPFGRLLMKM